MDILTQDLRCALRSFRNAPGFTAVVVLTLALGIGANTAIFSLVNEMLLRPLAIAEPERVVAVYTSDFSSGPFGTTSAPDFRDFRDQSQSLAGLAAYRQGSRLHFRTDEGTERVTSSLVSGEYFHVLGVEAHLGRLFTEDDALPGAEATALLGYGLWQDRFGGRSDVLGRQIQLNGATVTVVGVTPRHFRGTEMTLPPEVWLPLGQAEILFPGFGRRMLDRRGSRWLAMVGRLADGASREQAEAEMNAIMARLADEYPDSNRGTLQKPDEPRPMTVLAAADATLGGGRRNTAEGRAAVLMAIVGIVLLTACANVANLVLAQGRRRRTELAVRLALGAQRGRLIRQLLTESLLLSLAGGLAGILVAGALGQLLVPYGLTAAISRTARVSELALDARVLVFALLASLLTGLFCGLLPALRASRPDLVPALHSLSSSSTSRRGRLVGRDFLVVSQIAGSIVLLIGAGLFARSLQKAYAVDLGFDPANVLLVSIDLGGERLGESERRNFYAELRREVEALPGAVAASLSRVVPVAASGSRSTVRVEGYTPAEGEDMELNFNSVSPGYFAALGVPLLRGRGFTPSDSTEAPGVAVVNQAFADRFWTGENPIGRRIFAGGEERPPIEVVGLTSTGKYRSIREDPVPYIYYPLAQRTGNAVTLAVRSELPPMELFGPIREKARALRGGLPLSSVRTLYEHQGIALAQERNLAILVGALSLLALLIAAIGVYGVMSNAVSQRTREIGIRAALGARLSDIAGMILGHTTRLALLGTALGAVFAGSARGFVAQLLFEVSTADPLAFLGAGVLLIAVAMVAGALPAWRAAQVDPLVAVRED